MEKLTIRELEAKIDQLAGRIDTLTTILPDIKSPEAGTALQEQIEAYSQILDMHRAELAIRNRRL